MRITVPGPASQARGWRPRWARRTPGHGAATAVGSAQIPCAPKDQPATSPGTPVADAEAAPARSSWPAGSGGGRRRAAGRQLSARAIRRATPASDRGCDDSWHKDRRHRKGRVGAAGHRRPFIARPADAGLSGNWFQNRQRRRRGGITHKAFALWRFRANVAVSGKYGDWPPPEFPDRVERTQVITNPGPDSVADTLAGPRPVIIRVPPWRDPWKSGSPPYRNPRQSIRAWNTRVAALVADQVDLDEPPARRRSIPPTSGSGSSPSAVTRARSATGPERAASPGPARACGQSWPATSPATPTRRDVRAADRTPLCPISGPFPALSALLHRVAFVIVTACRCAVGPIIGA